MAHQKVVKDSKVLNILLEWQYNLWMKWFINIKYKSTLMIIHYLSITLMFFVNKLLYLLIKLRWKVTIWQHKLKHIYNHCFSENSPSDLLAQFWPNCMNYKGLYEMENLKNTNNFTKKFGETIYARNVWITILDCLMQICDRGKNSACSHQASAKRL